MYPIPVAIILVLTMGFFSYSIFNRFILFKVARGKDFRFDHIPTRIKNTLLYALGQKRFFSREWRVGLMHAIIFWGFCTLGIRTITLIGMGFSEDFHLPFFGHDSALGVFYNYSYTTFELLVSVAILYFLFRRIVTKPKRITLSTEGIVILCIILSLMISDFLFDGARTARTTEMIDGAYMGNILGIRMASLSDSTLQLIETISYFVHITLVLSFLNFLPYGKHFHIITAIPNVFFSNLKPKGQLTAINFEDEKAVYGNDKIEQFTWKNYLDWFSCTECGRCTSQCPANNSEKPLSPKEVSISLRNFLYKKQAKLVPQAMGKKIEGLDEAGLQPDEVPLLGDTIGHETLWSCTTCRACEEACPVFIEYVQEIVDMRRNLVMVQGSFPAEVQNVFVNMERNYNPWGIGYTERGSWAKELGVQTLAENPDVEYLYFAGCAANFDDKNKKVARALSLLLQKAGIKFGILGAEEKCTGDAARRLGNEYLAQTLMKDNVATFEKYKVKKVIASCPHCFNNIKNELPQFNGHYEVVHHTEVLNDLIKQGVLKPEKAINETVTYHDSCYLGRYNEVYDEPREILKSIPGINLVEPTNTRDKGRCCGAGGGRMWIEEKVGLRVNEMRLADLKETKASTAASACPFCKIMISDGINQTKTENFQTKDVVELLAESIGV